jgi:hypothetical protein
MSIVRMGRAALGRVGEPADLAAPAAHITGQTIAVDGGLA